MMLGFLLARMGVDVCVLEKHADFLRDFRGDTVHPSTLEVVHELGILEEFLRRRRERPVASHGRKRLRAVRILPAELEHLGEQSIGFISFLESAGVLPPPMREMVIDRASAIPGGPLDLEDLKIIVLMVFWSLGEEPDALILDELFVAEEDRLIH